MRVLWSLQSISLVSLNWRKFVICKWYIKTWTFLFLLSISASLGGIIEQNFCSGDVNSNDPIFKSTNGEGIAGFGEGGGRVSIGPSFHLAQLEMLSLRMWSSVNSSLGMNIVPIYLIIKPCCGWSANSKDHESIKGSSQESFTILRLTSGRKHEREKMKWQFQQYLQHVLKRSSVNSFLTAKLDKCSKNKHDVFPRKVSNAQEKVRGMLKAEFMKWLFRFGIIKLRLQLTH